jgi:hypothetical protein
MIKEIIIHTLLVCQNPNNIEQCTALQEFKNKSKEMQCVTGFAIYNEDGKYIIDEKTICSDIKKSLEK